MRVWEYDKRLGTPQEERVEVIAQRSDLEGDPYDGHDPSGRETTWAKSARHLINDWKRDALTPASISAHKQTMVNFAAFQRLRTPQGHRAAVSAIQIVDAVLGEDTGTPTTERRAREIQYNALSRPAGALAFRNLEQCLYRMIGVFIGNRTAQPFWLNDLGIAAFSNSSVGRGVRPSIDDFDVEVYVPLHPNLSIMPTRLQSFAEGTCICATPQDVEFYDMGLFNQAVRYRYSPTNDFSVAPALP